MNSLAYISGYMFEVIRRINSKRLNQKIESVFVCILGDITKLKNWCGFPPFQTSSPLHPPFAPSPAALLLAMQEVGLLGVKAMDLGARNPFSLLASCFEML